MLAIGVTTIDEQKALDLHESCMAQDYTVSSNPEVVSHGQECTLPVKHVVMLHPAPDMVIPVFVCMVHFNAFTLALGGGVGIIDDSQGD